MSEKPLRPVRPGRVSAHGRIIHRVGDTVFLEASLTNADGELAAISTATAQVIQLAEARKRRLSIGRHLAAPPGPTGGRSARGWLPMSRLR